MPAFPPVRLPLSVVYPSRRNLPPRTRIVIEFLADLLRADFAMRDDSDVSRPPDAEASDRDVPGGS